MFLLTFLLTHVKANPCRKTSATEMVCTDPETSIGLEDEDTIPPCDDMITDIKILSKYSVEIKGEGFTKCTSVKNLFFQVKDGFSIVENNFHVKNLETLTVYSGHKNRVVFLGPSSFAGSKLKEIKILPLEDESTKKEIMQDVMIETFAFKGAEGPMNVKINGSSAAIDLSAFDNCKINLFDISTTGRTDLKEAKNDFSLSIESPKITSGGSLSIETLFKSVTIGPIDITAESVFFGVNSFQSSNVKSIKINVKGSVFFSKDSFKGLENFESLEIEGSPTLISFDENSFESNGLKELKLESSISILFKKSSFQSSKLKTLNLKSERIDAFERAFFECFDLESATIEGKTIQYLEEAFACNNFKAGEGLNSEGELFLNNKCYMGCGTKCSDGTISDTPSSGGDDGGKKNGLSTGVIVAIVVVCVVVVAAVIVTVILVLKKKNKIGNESASP